MTAAPAIRIQGSARIGTAALFEPLTLDIEAGTWTCLLGASGIGKSTILRLVANLDDHVDFDGAVTAGDGAAISPRLAYMAQDDLLLPWATIRDNIAIGHRLRREPVDQEKLDGLIASVGLAEHANKKPAALSGGERQRAALARTLMEDKDIILLDEPFSALDAKTRSEMQDLSVKLLENRTVLLVTHDPAEAARIAHKIVVMTRSGLTAMPAPTAPVPRDVDDPDTLSAQGRLLKFLRSST